MAKLYCGGADGRSCGSLKLELTNGNVVRTRTVVASGARYRRPPIANLAEFEGAGVSYWASPVEAKLCAGEEVALVGGGNSAGQAVVYLAPKVKYLHLVVRGEGLEAPMSQYLIDRFKALPNVELHTNTEIVGLEGDGASGLTGAVFRCRRTGETHACALRHLFLFIGADPNAGWLEDCVQVDDKGFVVTGTELANGAGAARRPRDKLARRVRHRRCVRAARPSGWQQPSAKAPPSSRRSTACLRRSRSSSARGS